MSSNQQDRFPNTNLKAIPEPPEQKCVIFLRVPGVVQETTGTEKTPI